MKLLILAGGFGTRLRDTVPEVPKVLAPVNDKPFLEYQLESWISQGINSFVFLLYWQAELVIQFLESHKDGLLKNCKVEWVVEPEPLGTGGCVNYAIKQLHLDGEFLLINADTWLGSGITEIQNYAAPAMGIIKVADLSRYGCVKFDAYFKVTSFQEKSISQKPGWINAGLSLMSTDFFKKMNLYSFSLEELIFPKLVDLSLMKAVPLNCQFIDIGIPSDYQKFCNWIVHGKNGEIL